MSIPPTMKVKFWGTRGSIPASLSQDAVLDLQARLIQEIAVQGGTEKIFGTDIPSVQRIKSTLLQTGLGSDYLSIGGRTTCVEVHVKDSPLIVIDAGSGIQQLGQEMLGRYQSLRRLNPLAYDPEFSADMHLLFTHVHRDHIGGFPHFAPGYALEKRMPHKLNLALNLHLWGRKYGGRSILDILCDQQELPEFPVPFRVGVVPMWTHQTPITEDYSEFKIGKADVTAFAMPHSQETVTAYRIEDPSGKIFAFVTDVETGGDLGNNATHGIDSANVLYWDSQYTPEEYSSKKGWGHDTYERAVDHAIAARASRLLLGHHDSLRDDHGLRTEILEPARKYAMRHPKNDGLVVDLAYDGLEIEL